MRSEAGQQGTNGAFITPHARDEIVRRLQRATALATEDLGANFDLFCTALDDVATRIDALELMRSVTTGEHAAPLAADATTTVLASRVMEPVDEFLLIPFGRVEVERPLAGGDFEFTREQATQALRWFESIGRKLAIDYEHQSFDRFNTRSDGLRPAAGWIGGLALRDDGLWATNVEWTERAATMLGAGDSRTAAKLGGGRGGVLITGGAGQVRKKHLFSAAGMVR